jgi:aspartate aminotransferase-like enzyme
MLNFAVGPVQMEEKILQLGAGQIPYFRTAEFSQVMKENEAMMRRCMGASDDSRVLFLTGSGTAAMEAVVWNVFTPQDKVLVVNGGSFGARFAKLCRIHRIPYEEIRLEFGHTLTKEDLAPYEGQGYTGFLVNLLETSSGVSYDPELIHEFCERNGCLLACDAVSSFLADPLDMEKYGIDVALTGSQKDLALPPGISIVALNPEAIRRVQMNQIETMYFDLKDYLKDGERGQTPYTPAVSILLQMHARLTDITTRGLDAELKRAADLAQHFREGIRELPFTIVSDRLSNAVTPLHPLHASAYQIFLTLKDEYDIYVCPNGGELADQVFRVGHMGYLTKEDNQRLLDALKDMQNRGLL